MMFKVLSVDEVVQLKDELHHDLPGSAKIFYMLCSFLSGLLEGFEVIVDRWPDWTCIVLRPAADHEVPSYFRHYYICHTRSVKAFRFFIQRPCVVDWSKPIVFTGVPYDAVPTLQEQSRKHGGQLSSLENRFMYAWTKKELPEQPPLPAGLTLTTLEPQHIPALCDRWKNYRPDPALDLYMQVITQRFDSSAIVNEEGQLVAYIGMQFNGAMAMLHVDPQYRGRNLGQIVLADLTRKLLAKGKIAYGLIPTKDTSFIATSSQKLGFTWVPQGSMAWVRFVPKSALKPIPYPSVTVGSSTSAEVNKAESGGSQQQNPCSEEQTVQDHLHLTALPLSCNECSDISSEMPTILCPHVKVGIC